MKKNNAVTILLLAGIVILINVLGKQFFFRWDLTQGKQYTLSKATKDILQDLEDPVTIKAYFSKDLPANVQKTRTDFQEMLIEYSNLSKGMVDYEFINPNENQEIEQEALQAGIRSVMINVREKDQVKQQKAYLGAVVQLGEAQEPMPFIQPGGAMEYELTTNIKKLSASDKPWVGLLQGHGEPGIQELSQIYQQLSVLYEIEPLDLATTGSIDPKYKTIAMINPTDSISSSTFQLLDQFLANGGNFIVAFDRVQGDLSTAQGSALDIGIADWLATKGIQVDPSFVTDASCGSVTVQQRQGFFTMNTAVNFPYLPLIQSFKDHPITKGLEQVIFEFASPIRFLGDSTVAFTSIITSSDQSGSVQVPTFFDVNKQWNDSDFPQSNLTIGGLATGDFGGNGIPGNLAVFSDGGFAVSGQRGQNADNISLLVNTIDYMSDDTGLIDLRTKGVTSRPIEQLEDGQRTVLKYLNFGLPILLILIYGFIRTQRNKNIRLKRMQERWV